MQDGISLHMAKHTIENFWQNYVDDMSWISRSPDIDLIEDSSMLSHTFNSMLHILISIVSHEIAMKFEYYRIDCCSTNFSHNTNFYRLTVEILLRMKHPV